MGPYSVASRARNSSNAAVPWGTGYFLKRVGIGVLFEVEQALVSPQKWPAAFSPKPAFRCGLGFLLLGLAAGILAGSQSRRHAALLLVFLVNMVLSKPERIVP